MRHNAALATRIARLEARQRSRRQFPRMAFSIYDRDHCATAFTGHSGAICERLPGESLQALARRSLTVLGDIAIWAVYPPESPPEAMPGQFVPVPVSAAPFDRNALAGVGRRASDDELRAMAMLSIPAERLA